MSSNEINKVINYHMFQTFLQQLFPSGQILLSCGLQLEHEFDHCILPPNRVGAFYFRLHGMDFSRC